MVSIEIRHLRIKASGYYFQPSKSMAAAGFCPEALGKDMATAVARVGALNAEWDAVRHGDAKAAPELPPVGTTNRLIYDYGRSAKFNDLKRATQDEFDAYAPYIQKVFGKSRITSISPEQVEKFYDALRRKYSVHKTAKIMKIFSKLMNRAIKLQLIVFNPLSAVEVKQPRPRKQLWTPEQVEKAKETAWDDGYPATAVAIGIGYDTGLSPVDVRTLTMEQLQGNVIIRERTKTGRKVELELLPETMDLIKAYHNLLGLAATPNALVIRTRRGRPYTKDILAKDFRAVRRKAGLPECLQLQDLRRTASSEEANAGATEAEIAARRGWSMKTASKNMDTYVVRSRGLASSAQSKRQKNMRGSK